MRMTQCCISALGNTACVVKPRQTIHAEKQHVLHAAVMQVIQHPQPELAGFIRPPTVVPRISLQLSAVTPKTT